MRVMLGFSDEAGWLKKNSWYVRTLYLVDSDKYQKLSRNFIKLKEEFKIPLDREFKFNWLWKIERHPNKIKEKEGAYFFKEYKASALKEFVSKSIRLLDNINPCLIVVYTFIFENLLKKKSDTEIEKDFMNVILLRVEDELLDSDSLAIIFYDETKKKDKLSQAYKKIFLSARFVEKYEHIKDSLSFEISRYSTGLQLADYVTAVTHNFLRGYSFSENLFKKHLFRWIRRKNKISIRRTGFIPLYLNSTPRGRTKLKEIGDKFKSIIKECG